jgi:outer membrane protein OmpA-like peptidoglycan-associated protein
LIVALFEKLLLIVFNDKNRKINMKKQLFRIMLSATLLSGCITDPNTGESHVSATAKGAGIGAAAGAGTGALFGGNRLANAGWGALAGGALGAAVGAYMDSQEKDMRMSLQGTGVQVQRTAENTLNLTMPSNVTFAFDSAVLTPEAQNALDSVAKVLNQYQDSTITVTGHTDDIGSDKYNQRLSELRAASVATYLAQHNVNATRIIQQGMGKTMPKVPNTSDANRAQNRRVEMAIKANQNAGTNQSGRPQQQPYPQQGGYPPPANYPQQQTYPQQGGYPQQPPQTYPQQGGYPAQGNYPPQQQTYPPQSGYPQQQKYPQSGSYPQQQTYPQQGGYPQPQTYPQQPIYSYPPQP